MKRKDIIVNFLPNRKFIGQIYRNDWKEILSNKILLIIVIGLTLIPSLYAWFNIEAFWDPYGNTKNIKVAIVNKDQGGKFRNQEIKLGDRIVDNLRANENLKWEFVSEKYANEKLRAGEYYAIITIPNDFTKDLLSVTKENVKKAEIEYKINEKTNAIAPKITDQGANKIKENISKMLVETVSKASIGAIGGVSTTIESINPNLDKMKETLKQLKTEISNAEKLNSSSQDLSKNTAKSIEDSRKILNNIKDLNNQSKNLNNNIANKINESSNRGQMTSEQISNSLNRTSSNLYKADKILNDVENMNSQSSADLQTSIGDLENSLNTNISNIEAIIGFFEGVDNGSNIFASALSKLHSIDDKLNNYKDKLSQAKQAVEIGGTLNENLLSDLKSYNNDLINQLDSINNSYPSLIGNKMQTVRNEASQANTSVGNLIDSVNEINPNIESMLNNADNINKTVSTSIKINSLTLNNLKNQIDNSIKLIEKIQNNKDLKEFNKVIKSNIYDRVDFLKNPVEVKETKIFPIKNYGSAMAPFYSVLACWVGALILCAVLNTKAIGHVYSPIDKYFGRLMLFLNLAVFQALIIGLGDLILLGVSVKHVLLFILSLVISSMVFCTIVYSLTVLFGTVGKGLAVFLLVIQIGGSGGTFPVQMTPQFFRTINKFIPFTYGINACREAIGGVYMPNLVNDFIALAIFAAIPILFSIAFKGKLMKINSPITKKLTDSFLIH